MGGANDLSGRTGVGAAELDRFLARGKAYRDWKAFPQAPRAKDAPPILPWGADTEAAAEAVKALELKVEQYFRQCDLVQHEAKAVERLRIGDEQLKALEVTSPAAIEKTLEDATLAPPRAGGALPMGPEANPLFRDRLLALKERALVRVLPKKEEPKELTRASWAAIKTALEPYFAWRASKPAEPFEKLGDERLAAVLADGAPDVTRLRALIAEDKAAAAELAEIANVEKLLLLQRWLLEFANNFVNFSALFDPGRRSLFEMGTLVIDGRRLEFSMRVAARDAHKKIAAESLTFLVYAQVSDSDGKPAFEVAAPVTAGERGRLRVGKRGIFVGVDGKEWDAQIVDLIESPISLWEAAKSPFTRLKKFVGDKVESFAGSKLAAAEKDLMAKAAAPPPPPPPPPPGAPPPPPGGAMMNLMIGGGIALAALSSAVAFAVASLSKVNPLAALAAVAGLVGAVLFVSGFLGWLKLRRRDLGMILEASGWALNAQVKLTGRVARVFTQTPLLPDTARLERVDLLKALEIRSVEERHRKIFLRLAALAVLVVLLATLAYVLFGLGYWSEIAARLDRS